MFNSSGYSLSDIAAVSGNNNNKSGWGENGAWWIIIFFIVALVWGGNGFGNRGNNNGGGSDSVLPYLLPLINNSTTSANGALTRADLCQDMNFSDLQNSVRGLSNGLCDGFYAQNSALLNGFGQIQNQLGTGFAGVDRGLCELSYNIQNGLNAVNIGQIQSANALSTQLGNCCCENRQGQADIKYQMATDACAITNTIQNTTRDVIDSQNAKYQGIMDKLCQMEYNTLNDKYQTTLAENQSLKFQISQTAQNGYINTVGQSIVNQLRDPCPIPAYVVPNPNCCCNNGLGLTAAVANGLYGLVG